MAEIRTTADAMNAGLRTSTTRGAQWQVGQYLDFSQDGVKGYWRIKEIVKYDFNNPEDVAKWEATEGWNFERIKQQGGKLLEQVMKPNSKTFLLERVDSLPAGETAIKEPMRYPYGPDGKSYDPSFMKLNQTPAAVAPSAPAAGATETAAAPQASEAPRSLRQEAAYKIENNVYSGSNDPLLAALTNSTNDILPYRDKNAPGSADRPNSSFEKGKITSKYPVVIDGKVFPSAEHAYSYYTRGEYDVNIQEAKMADVIAAKLQQHPDLYASIEKRGGSQWIDTLNSYTGMGGKRDPNVSHWEGSGRDSGFIRALSAAFDKVKSLPPVRPEDQALVEWAQDKNNWNDFPKADRGGKPMQRARQNYYVSGTKPVTGPSTRQQEALSNFQRMSELATGNVESSSAGVRLRRTIGASAPYGSFYDIGAESRDIAQIDERLRGQDVKSLVSKLATEFGVPLQQPKSFDLQNYRRLVEEFLVSANKLADLKSNGQEIRGSKFSPGQAEEVTAIMKQLSNTFSNYADPGSRIEARGVRRLGPEGVRGTVSPMMQVAADLARVGIEIDINDISAADKATADALSRSYGMDSLFNPADSASNASATRPLVGAEISGAGAYEVHESKYTNPDQLAVDASGDRFGAKIEYRPNFQAAPGNRDTKANAAANEAIANTIKYFPGLNPAITAPDGFSRVDNREFGASYELDRGYHPDMADAGKASLAKGVTPDPDNLRIHELALQEIEYKGSSQAEKGKPAGKIVSVLELAKPQNAAMLDQILRDHTPGRISARRSRIAISTSQVGPAAALVEGNNPTAGELDIATLVADLRKIEAMPKAERTMQINVRAKSIRVALDGVKIFVPPFGVFDKVAGKVVSGSVIPLIRVKPRYKVLPGGAMLSQDGRYIDAFGFPKVEPYVFKNGTIEQINAPEAIGSPETASSKPIESPTVQSPNKTSGFEVDNYQERMLNEASNKKKYPINEDLARYGYERELMRFSRQDLAQEATKNFLIDQGDLLKASGSLDSLPILRNKLDIGLRNVDPVYAKSRVASIVNADITGGPSDRFNLGGLSKRLTADFSRPTSSINYADIHEGTIHPAMKVFLNGLYQLSDVAREHASTLGAGQTESVPRNVIIQDAEVVASEELGTKNIRSMTREKFTAALADGIASAIDRAGTRIASGYSLDYNAPVGQRVPIVPDLSKRAEQIRASADQGATQMSDPGQYGDLGPQEDMGTPVEQQKVGKITNLPVETEMPAPRGARPDALSKLSDEVALMMAGKLAPDEKAALSKVFVGVGNYPKGSLVPDGGLLTLVPGMTEEQVAAKVFADGWERFSKAQLYDIANHLLPNGELPKLGEPHNFNETPKITLQGERGAVRYDVLPGVTPGTGLGGGETPAALTLRVSENQPKGTFSGVRPGTEITITDSGVIKEISKNLRQIYQGADNVRLQANLNEFVSLFGPNRTITFNSLVDAIDAMPGAKITEIGPAVRAYALWDQALKGNIRDVRRYLESQIPPEVVPTISQAFNEPVANDNTSEMLPSGDESLADVSGQMPDRTGPYGADIPDGKSTVISETPRRRADAAMVRRMPSISAPLDFNAAASQASIKASMGASVGHAISGFHKLNQAAFHGPVGFGAGAIADTAYLAAKGWLTPESLAMSVGFNGLNLVNPESLVKLGIPSKIGSKLGLVGAVAGLGLTAATGGDLGRGIATTAGGLIGALGGGALGGGFGAIGGSIAGSEIGDYVWSELLGNGRKQPIASQVPEMVRGPRFVN
jgi:hypothetical protein